MSTVNVISGGYAHNNVILPVWASELRNFNYSDANMTIGPDGTITIKPTRPTLAYRISVADGILQDADYECNTWDYDVLYPAIFVTANKAGRTFCGSAVCAPEDEFNETIGAAIAYCRAVGKAIPSCLTHF